MELHVVYIQMESASGGGVSQFQTRRSRNMFFANDPYHIDETVDYKGDGTESHFFCKSNFLQMGWSIAKRTVWNNTFRMKSETMLKCFLLFEIVVLSQKG